MPTLKIDDKVIYYKISGEGKPVILLHGFCEDHRIWDSIYRNIPGRILRFDLPGFGRSQAISSVNLNECAHLISRIIKKLGFNKYILFGHSMGGYIGLEILKNYSI